MKSHRGVDIMDGYATQAKTIYEPVFDVTTGSIYELVFSCVDEQAQTRGGLVGHGEHVVNLQKIEKLQDEFEERVNKYFKGLDGITIETGYSLGNVWSYSDCYVFFKIKIRQTLRSMWDVNIDSMTLGFAKEVADLVKYLHTDHTDRTELILNALEHGKK